MFVGIVLMLLFASATSGQRSATDKDSIPTITACEALSHPSEYDGKLVHLRDQVGSTDEGAWFIGENCPGIFVTDGKVWPSQIAWTMPTDLMMIIHPVNFSFDWNSSKELHKKERRLLKHAPASCLAITYTGMFESWSKEKAKKFDSHGKAYEVFGFGHLSGSPAQLVLKSADDVMPIPNCHSKG